MTEAEVQPDVASHRAGGPRAWTGGTQQPAPTAVREPELELTGEGLRAKLSFIAPGLLMVSLSGLILAAALVGAWVVITHLGDWLGSAL